MYKKLRFLLTLFAFLFILSGAKAQYTTPGNNESLSLQDLVSLSGGVVSETDGDFFINSTLTIAATDTLKILEAETIRTAATVRIEIMGKFISDPTEGRVVFTAQDTTSTAANFKGFRFEDADTAVFRNTVVKYGGGIQLIDTEGLFEYCIIRNNGHSNVSAAINYSNSSPVIRYSEFRENSRSALASGANVQGSPEIMFSSFIHNTTENSNRPQINLGPGAADTIKIVGNYIEGLYPIAGGIAVSNLLGGGSSKVLIADNVIVNNRYGYAQTGNNISSVIRGNTITDNDIQDNPMQGGSGLNFNGVTNNHAIVRSNLISGNLWGVTIQNTAQPDFGDAEDQGGNVFFDNGNSGIVYALYNNTPNPINAIGNYWGGNTEEEAEQFIVHQPDDASLGLVTFSPVMVLHPVVNSFAFRADDNEGLQEDLQGVIDAENFQVTVSADAETDITQLVPDISVALGVSVSPDVSEPQDFSQPVEYLLSVPHGEEQVWTVTVLIGEPDLFAVSFDVTDDIGASIDNAVVTLNGTTNAAGDYLFEEMEPGEYNYTVVADDYEQFEGSVEVIDQDVVVEVTLSPITYQLTFIVKDEQGTDINNAVVTLDGSVYEPGEYVFENMTPGSYDYTVEADGFHLVDGTVEITDADKEVLVELEAIVSVNEWDNTLFLLYPNPAAQYVVLQNKTGAAATIVVSDLQGKIILEDNMSGAGEKQINVEALKEGIYLLRLVTEEKIMVRKISVIR